MDDKVFDPAKLTQLELIEIKRKYLEERSGRSIPAGLSSEQLDDKWKELMPSSTYWIKFSHSLKLKSESTGNTLEIQCNSDEPVTLEELLGFLRREGKLRPDSTI